jgi:hypothetical protein
MSGRSKFAIDRRPPRVDWEKLRAGPTEEALREIPPTTAADWEDAERVIFVDKDTFEAVRDLLDARRKKSA